MSFTTPPPLGIPVPIFGITGEIYTGKTLLAMSVAPGVFKDGPHAGKPRSLYFDFEQSGASYAGAGLERIDAPDEMRKRFGSNNYKPVDIFEWFRQEIVKIPAYRFDTIIADPITDVEEGLVDYVRANPAQFGYTKDQFASGSGLMWGAVKNFWKLILVDLSARAQMFTFVSHMRMEFSGGRPTGRMIPKGKETLAEIASLYLRLDRDQTRDGEKPQPPSAVILKERLSVTSVNEKGELEVVKMLPDRLPICTVQALRHYISHPVGKRKLKPEELIQEKALTDDERLVLQAEIEKNRADAEAKRLELWNMQQAQSVLATMGVPGMPPPPPALPPQAVAQPPQPTPPPPQQAAPPPAAPPALDGAAADPELVEAIVAIKTLGRELYGSPPVFGEAFKAYWANRVEGYTRLDEMNVIQALTYKFHLKSELAKKHVADKHGYQAPDPIQGTPPPPTDSAAPIEPFKGKEPLEPDQLETLKALCNPNTPGGMSTAEQEAWRAHFGVQKMRDLNQEQYQFLMTRRSERLAKKDTTQPA